MSDLGSSRCRSGQFQPGSETLFVLSFSAGLCIGAGGGEVLYAAHESDPVLQVEYVVFIPEMF
mgnify:CR=1 FL=1